MRIGPLTLPLADDGNFFVAGCPNLLKLSKEVYLLLTQRLNVLS